MCHEHEYVDREYRHIPDIDYDVTLSVNFPKLHCSNCNRYPQVRFPLARPKVSYTKEVEMAVADLSKAMDFQFADIRMPESPVKN